VRGNYENLQILPSSPSTRAGREGTVFPSPTGRGQGEGLLRAPPTRRALLPPAPQEASRLGDSPRAASGMGDCPSSPSTGTPGEASGAGDRPQAGREGALLSFSREPAAKRVALVLQWDSIQREGEAPAEPDLSNSLRPGRSLSLPNHGAIAPPHTLPQNAHPTLRTPPHARPQVEPAVPAQPRPPSPPTSKPPPPPDHRRNHRHQPHHPIRHKAIADRDWFGAKSTDAVQCRRGQYRGTRIKVFSWDCKTTC
jgi:hypothetical protein